MPALKVVAPALLASLALIGCSSGPAVAALPSKLGLKQVDVFLTALNNAGVQGNVTPQQFVQSTRNAAAIAKKYSLKVSAGPCKTTLVDVQNNYTTFSNYVSQDISAHVSLGKDKKLGPIFRKIIPSIVKAGRGCK